ncbi:MAG: prefoldin subunit beta [Candidatus Micrarchaeota archaeon]
MGGPTGRFARFITAERFVHARADYYELKAKSPKLKAIKRVICVKPDPELERSLVEYQNAERQLQSIVLQKHQLQLQLNEISLAEEELKKSKGDVFKSIGSVMVKTTKEDADKDLKERQDLAKIRSSTLEKQEEKLRAHLSVLQKKLEDKMKGYKMGGGAGESGIQ